ncbi:RNA methyltransferase [Oscillatoriales cyanobacterium USR001]|nr:RNA methyltransferase [Oscillatoriales cyanobacterium USR001]
MSDKVLDRIRIILVEPAGPLNIGSVARVMKNMGLQQLFLVNPQCDYLEEDARKMAVHAIDVLASAKIVSTLPEALEGCQRAIATTGLYRSLPTALENPKSALPWLLECPSALIFGREDTGLTNAELSYAQRLIRIPTNDVYPSLNLAQAVAICCYELYQLIWERGEEIINYPLPITDDQLSISSQASLEALEGYYQQLEALLLKVGYLYPHTAPSRMEKFRRLFNRAYPSSAEVSMLRGIFRQINWALETYPKNSIDDTLDGSRSDSLPG